MNESLRHNPISIMSKKCSNNTLMKGKEKQDASKSSEVDKLCIAEELVFFVNWPCCCETKLS